MSSTKVVFLGQLESKDNCPGWSVNKGGTQVHDMLPFGPLVDWSICLSTSLWQGIQMCCIYFQVLQLITPTVDSSQYKAAIDPENIGKNRVKNVLPGMLEKIALNCNSEG